MENYEIVFPVILQYQQGSKYGQTRRIKRDRNFSAKYNREKKKSNTLLIKNLLIDVEMNTALVVPESIETLWIKDNSTVIDRKLEKLGPEISNCDFQTGTVREVMKSFAAITICDRTQFFGMIEVDNKVYYLQPLTANSLKNRTSPPHSMYTTDKIQNMSLSNDHLTINREPNEEYQKYYKNTHTSSTESVNLHYSTYGSKTENKDEMRVFNNQSKRKLKWMRKHVFKKINRNKLKSVRRKRESYINFNRSYLTSPNSVDFNSVEDEVYENHVEKCQFPLKANIRLEKDCFIDNLNPENRRKLWKYIEKMEGNKSTLDVGYFLDPLYRTDVSSGTTNIKWATSPLPQRWLELAIAVDQSVILFHGKKRIQQYIFALFNIVSAIYKDPSLDSNLSLTIVRLIFFENESESPILQGNSKKSLENVNHWNHKILSSLDAEKRHDVAVWLTRKDLGGPSGYAPVSGACDPARSCTLNRDEGLTSAFIIAHEVAHVLGLTHDGDQGAGNGCGQEAKEGSVMAPMVSATFHRFTWSPCSKMEFHKKTMQWKCLTNPPQLQSVTLLKSKLQEKFSMDEQCRMEFGEGYTMCHGYELPELCSHLWCGHDTTPDLCKTKKGPPLEGTECGVNHWCVNGFCELVDPKRFGFEPILYNPRDGNWSEWSDWSRCSRSCGYGVSFRTRMCDNPRPAYGGADCKGKSEEFKICNTQSCPLPGNDFRAEQCSRMLYLESQHPYDSHNDSWLPYESDQDFQKCQLTCMSLKKREIIFTGQNLLDGTLCSYEGDSSICIQGECQLMGCDGVLSSTVKEDNCGVCGGNGSECKHITTTFVKKIKRDITRINTIPQLAFHIKVEVNSTMNLTENGYETQLTLRVHHKRKHVVHIGKEEYDSVLIIQGARFHCVKDKDSLKIWARGPTLGQVIISVLTPRRVLHKEETISVYFTYWQHKNVFKNSSKYVWDEGGWGPCSQSCGGGKRRKTIACRDLSTGTLVSKRYCISVQKPKLLVEKCNTFSCDFVWYTTEWEHCSATCGSRGEQERQVYCIISSEYKTNTSLLNNVVHPKKCANKDKPVIKRFCNRIPCPAYWTLGNWSQCSATCGLGYQTREFHCLAPRGEPLFDCGPSPSDKLRTCKGMYRHSHSLCKQTEIPCKHDSSKYCRLLDLLGRYCIIPGFNRFCCKSCSLVLNVLPE